MVFCSTACWIDAHQKRCLREILLFDNETGWKNFRIFYATDFCNFRAKSLAILRENCKNQSSKKPKIFETIFIVEEQNFELRQLWWGEISAKRATDDFVQFMVYLQWPGLLGQWNVSSMMSFSIEDFHWLMSRVAVLTRPLYGTQRSGTVLSACSAPSAHTPSAKYCLISLLS